MTQYRFHSGADLEPAHGRRRPFRTFAPGSRETIVPRCVPPVHCSIAQQRRLNPDAALRSDFKGDTFPDSRWSWRPPITSVSKPWRVTYRTRNRTATLVCVETRAVPSTPRRIQGDKRRTGILGLHTRDPLLIASTSRKDRGIAAGYSFSRFATQVWQR